MNLLNKTHFPFFRAMPNAHYLDNAATTQIPSVVMTAMQEALTERGNPGRGSHALAVRAQARLEEARLIVAEYIRARPGEIVFTKGTTDGLHLFVESILPLLESDDAIAISIVEHHASLLAWQKVAVRGARLKSISLLEGILTVENVCAVIAANTKVLVMQHVSNVTGIIHPIADIVRAVRTRYPDVVIVVDGAQAVAHLSVDVHALDVDAYVFSGHKVYGPDGVGVLYVHERLQPKLAAVRLGGGGVKSVHAYHVDGELHIQTERTSGLTHFESGTLNLTAIIGLAAAIRFLNQVGIETLRVHERRLRSLLMAYLKECSQVELVSPPLSESTVGIISFRLRSGSVAELEHLFAEQQIFIRYGAHCAAPFTDALGGETFRVSFGCYNDEEDIRAVMECIDQMTERQTHKIPAVLPTRKTVSIATQSVERLFETVRSVVTNSQEVSIAIMSGHCLGIPDRRQNTFIPSIPSLLRPDLKPSLKEFGMEFLSSMTWQAGCELVARFKNVGIRAQLLPIINDTTGMNELRQQMDPKMRKTAEEYRRELHQNFVGQEGVPEEYLAALATQKLSLKDVMKTPEGYWMGEHGLRKRFHQNFVHRNKRALAGLVEYGVDQHGMFDLQLPIFGERIPSACTFDTFQSKTGGKFCVVEVSQFLAELFGQIDQGRFARISERMQKPLISSPHQILILFTPAMCNNAVNQGIELYLRLMRNPCSQTRLDVFQLPIGPRTSSIEGSSWEVTHLK